MIDLRNEVVDILAKMKFFQGQRAGRKLWNDKPFEVQEKDLESFNTGIETIRKYILHLEEQPKVGEWIPVEERLPEGCDDAEIELLISTHEAYPDALFEETGFALYYPKTKSFHSVYGCRLEITEIVTAWKYLPEPYMRKKVKEK